jgi:hypothetical protein
MLGNTAPGSVEGTLGYTAQGQAMFIRYVPTPKPDLTGRIITGWVYVVSTTGTIQLSAFANDLTNTSFLGGTAVTVNPGDTPTWIKVVFTIPAKAAGWDPTNINQFGIQIVQTDTMGDAGTAVVAVDDYSVQ